MYWYTPRLRNGIDGRTAHAMYGRQGVQAVCGTFMSIYGRIDPKADMKCIDCLRKLGIAPERSTY